MRVRLARAREAARAQMLHEAWSEVAGAAGGGGAGGDGAGWGARRGAADADEGILEEALVEALLLRKEELEARAAREAEEGEDANGSNVSWLDGLGWGKEKDVVHTQQPEAEVRAHPARAADGAPESERVSGGSRCDEEARGAIGGGGGAPCCSTGGLGPAQESPRAACGGEASPEPRARGLQAPAEQEAARARRAVLRRVRMDLSHGR